MKLSIIIPVRNEKFLVKKIVEQLENKFRPMALQYGDLPESQLNELLSKLWNLESVNNIDEVIELTAKK